MILITGAGGYLGARLCARFAAEGRPAVGIGRAQCDLADAKAVRGLIEAHAGATVIHCAAQVPGTARAYADDEIAEASVAMVRHLIAARPAALVFTSSMTVYQRPGSAPVVEQDAPPPGSGYAGGKRRAELLLAEAPFPATVLRLPGLFGPPRRGGLVFNLAHAFARSEQPSLPAEPPIWAAMHVDDASWMVVRAATLPAEGYRVFNLGYPGRHSLADVAARLAGLFGVAAPCFDAPEFEMDLSRTDAALGRPPLGYVAALAGMAAEAREAAPC